MQQRPGILLLAPGAGLARLIIDSAAVGRWVEVPPATVDKVLAGLCPRQFLVATGERDSRGRSAYIARVPDRREARRPSSPPPA